MDFMYLKAYFIVVKLQLFYVKSAFVYLIELCFFEQKKRVSIDTLNMI